MTGNMKIGVALVGGYLLGRTKKAKMAIGFGMFLAGKKLSLDPRQLGKMLADSPVLGGLNDQVRSELVGATKAAATNALTQRATGLADSLHQRTLELESPDGVDADDQEPEVGEEDADRGTRDDAADEQDDEGADEGADEKPAPRRRTAAKSSAKSAGRAASGAHRATSGGARKKTTQAKRRTSGARETASSNARKDRGGDNG